MTDEGERELKRLLEGVNAGQAGAVDELSAAIYDHLRRMARRHLARDFGPGMAGVTIQPTVLANDTLMKLIRQRQQFDNAGHFFAIASRLMMRVLIDYHRERNAAKRGGSIIHVPLGPEHAGEIADSTAGPADGPGVDAETVDAVLEKLSRLDVRKADVVRYRILWGLTNREIAETLGVALATVERDWAFARVWLAKELSCQS
jgi:RNA polymerase sigma factor (TIGR02999 family)